jgi:hypothetical protein
VPEENTEPTQWLTTSEAATHVRLSPKTLEKLRSQGQGPPWHRPDGGRTIRYDLVELDAWLRGPEVSQ